jgi:predicted SnoaL-like aldol condensation-catalyzing enzyme
MSCKRRINDIHLVDLSNIAKCLIVSLLNRLSDTRFTHWHFNCHIQFQLTSIKSKFMAITVQGQNKEIVEEAFDAVFNRRDESAFERYWSADYVQHSAHIPPGREGLKGLVAQLPKALKYEIGHICAEGDFVIVHGRFTNIGQPKAWIAADIIRMSNGKLVEHWDVIENEVRKDESSSGAPMFGDTFSEV